MPWLETSSVEQRERFIADERRGLYTRTELCARGGISRKTGYKWLDRYHEDGRRGLPDRSHVPHHSSHRISPGIADLVCTAGRRHPDSSSCYTASPRPFPERLPPLEYSSGKARHRERSPR
jgi:putative transposase